ncbi:MAG TPA: hypothetical protein VI037_00485 [Nitrososphaera sp.]
MSAYKAIRSAFMLQLFNDFQNPQQSIDPYNNISICYSSQKAIRSIVAFVFLLLSITLEVTYFLLQNDF